MSEQAVTVGRPVGAVELPTPWASERAFEEAVTPFLHQMHGIARGILGSDDLAWDAVQESLLRLWRGGALKVVSPGTLGGAVRRSCLHILRCHRRRQDHEALSVDLSPCCERDPLGDACSKEAAERTREAIQRLAEEHRRVVELVSQGGQSYTSAARELGVPVGTVRSRLSRARSELLTMLPWLEEA